MLPPRLDRHVHPLCCRVPEVNHVVVLSTLCDSFHRGPISANSAEIVAPVGIWLVRVATPRILQGRAEGFD